MQSTEQFKDVITVFVATKAIKDDNFAKSLGKEGKNIDDCITYILNTVKKSGCTAFTDEEIYGMAIHYYDEDKIEVGSKVSCNVVHTKPAISQEEAQTEEPEDYEDNDEPDETDDNEDPDETGEPEIPNRPVSRDSNQLSIF